MGNIGENIKRLRIENDLSQEQLARMIGKSRAAISQYESGTNIPRMGVIEDLAAVFMVSKSEILGESRRRDLSYDESNLIELYRSMDKMHRDMLLETARSFAALGKEVDE